MLEKNDNSTKAVHGLLIDKLAKLPEDTILDEKKLAEIIEVSSRTLRRMVQRRELPPAIPLGGHSIWLSGRILNYLNNVAEEAEKDALKEKRRIMQYSP